MQISSFRKKEKETNLMYSISENGIIFDSLKYFKQINNINEKNLSDFNFLWTDYHS